MDAARGAGPQRTWRAERPHQVPTETETETEMNEGPSPADLALDVCAGQRGGGYEIRTREGVNPTRFPSVRPRPLGESSVRQDTDPAQPGFAGAPSIRRHGPGTLGTSPSCGVYPVNLPRAGRQQG